MLRKRPILLFTCILLIATSVRAQLTPDLLPLSAVGQFELPALNNDSLRANELGQRRPGRAPHFALSRAVDIRPENTGTWERLPDGGWMWRIRIRSAGAYSINLGFTAFHMPPGAQLMIYSPSGEEQQGPFSAADNEDHNQLWTPVLKGDETVLEVRLPHARRNELQLWLTSVNHDFLDFHSLLTGNCHLDVVCGAEDGWGVLDNYRDIIQSVAVYGLGGETFCTGFLINNTNEDCTPYFMTAHHCEVGPGNAPSLVAYWNYQNSYCREPETPASGNPGNGSLDAFNSGAIFRAGNNSTDFVLLELDDPVNESANAYFAGWSRAETPPEDTLVCVHHPDGAEKRVSFAFGESYPGNWGSGNTFVPDGNHLIVPNWSIGSTEFGSSGAPLFNREEKVVGQLHGGGASCGNSSYDAFGWLQSSWDGSSSISRLSDWLDPSGSNVSELDGRWKSACDVTLWVPQANASVCAPGQATYEIEVGEAFTGSVNLTTEGLPTGVTATFNNNPVSPGSTVVLTLDIEPGIGAVGSTNFIIRAGGDYNTLEVTASLNIYVTPPETVELLEPADAALGVGLAPELEWVASNTALSYDVQLAQDSAFSDILVSVIGLGASTYGSAVLSSNSVYYYRVRARNLCGTGPWSKVRSFRTAATQCQSRSALDLPVIINSGQPGTYESRVNINAEGTVAGVRIRSLRIAHTFVGDLSVSLRSPSGNTVKLLDRPGFPNFPFGCAGDDLELSFADEAGNTAQQLESSCNNLPAIAGHFQPIEAFANFIGEPAEGEWELIVKDNFNDDGGTILQWELEVCLAFPNRAQIFLPDAPYFACAGQPFSADLYVGTAFSSSVELSLSGLPPGVEAQFGENPVLPGQFVNLSLQGISEAGSLNFNLTASDGTENHDCPVSVQVSKSPNMASLFLPEDGSLLVNEQPLFSWSPVSGADTFRLEIARDPDFTDMVLQQTLFSTQYNTQAELPYNTYYWRVVSLNKCGSTNSLSRSFAIEPGLTSTRQAEGREVFSVYPNPTTGVLRLQIKKGSPQQRDHLLLFNAHGQQLRRWPAPLQPEIDLSSYPAGLYWLLLEHNGQHYRQRIVLE